MSSLYTARTILTHLFAEAVEWKEDVDGDIEDGVTRTYVNHHICVSDGVLQELLDMAGIPQKQGETVLSALERANEEDQSGNAFTQVETAG